MAPGVIQSELTQASGAGGGAYGLAMSMYFLAYAPAQLLVGRLPLLLISETFGWRMPLLLCAVAGLMIAARI